MTSLQESGPRFISGGIALDDRGTVMFVNDFDFYGIRRFYVLQNFVTGTIRAFHGHLKEEKCFAVVSGSAIVAAVRLDSAANPDRATPVDRFILSSCKPGVLKIPVGYANGFRALEEDTRIVVFSSSSVNDASEDDYRFPADYWGSNIWTVENR